MNSTNNLSPCLASSPESLRAGDRPSILPSRGKTKNIYVVYDNCFNMWLRLNFVFADTVRASIIARSAYACLCFTCLIASHFWWWIVITCTYPCYSTKWAGYSFCWLWNKNDTVLFIKCYRYINPKKVILAHYREVSRKCDGVISYKGQFFWIYMQIWEVIVMKLKWLDTYVKLCRCMRAKNRSF